MLSLPLERSWYIEHVRYSTCWYKSNQSRILEYTSLKAIKQLEAARRPAVYTQVSRVYAAGQWRMTQSRDRSSLSGNVHAFSNYVSVESRAGVSPGWLLLMLLLLLAALRIFLLSYKQHPTSLYAHPFICHCQCIMHLIMQKAMSTDSWPLMRRGRYCEEILRSWTTASHSRVEMAKNKLSVCSFKCRRLHRAIGASSTGVVYTVCLYIQTDSIHHAYMNCTCPCGYMTLF